MRWFSFFTKFVFICNICFLATVVMQYNNVENLPQWVVATVLTLGWFLSVLINFVFLTMIIYFFIGRANVTISPLLTLCNILISIFQFIYIFIIKHDS